ncbi:MAG: deoxyribodipyrimidine photolyase [Gammaproteobacteria bacterium RIFCSPLOWO2_02_FULL_57_10]|nr:MAG: deoxyribodipyrimidine photolyase [Gammaproteobacteria bacterium RIFCSPLOWO2_02_FULL_57_10]
MTRRTPITTITSTAATSIVWFRQDLRLADNPALTAAAQVGSVLPVYILDDINSAEWAMGGASRWWLHHSLSALNESLGGRLVVLRGDPLLLLPELAKKTNAQAVFWNRCYEPWRIARDTRIKERLHADSITMHSHNGSLLWEPWQILKGDQTPYQMFTPYYRKGCLQASAPRTPLPVPPQLSLLESPGANTVGQSAIDALNLLPTIPWDRVMTDTWKIGEAAAHQRLHDFLEEGLAGYREGRNIPQRPNVSRLSPHLHYGEVSPNQVWAMAQRLGMEQRVEDDLDCFLSELGWREFSYYLLFHRPTLPRENLQRRFDRFPWRNDPQQLSAWQRGMTGYPLVDAGMRELWQTGYMHNRVRMVVGSFLVKNLLTHWHHGEDWFWDCLVDADLASNSASWQWIAGCGADAAPYFRVFNPVTQSEKFDPQGVYIRRYVPELAALPDKYLHDPSSAPSMVLSAAGVVLGKTYPRAIVDLKSSREEALLAFKSLQEML